MKTQQKHVAKAWNKNILEKILVRKLSCPIQKATQKTIIWNTIKPARKTIYWEINMAFAYTSSQELLVLQDHILLSTYSVMDSVKDKQVAIFGEHSTHIS